MDGTRARGILRFLTLAGRLKETDRAGWKLQGIDAPESVADHTFGVCLLALVLSRDASPPLRRDRCVAMALVHDLAEALVGDITPFDGVSNEEKDRREREAMTHLSTLLGDPEILELWEEYQRAATPESRFVRDLDKLETVVQAVRYEQGRGANVDEFIANGADRAWLPLTGPVYKELMAVRSGAGIGGA